MITFKRSVKEEVLMDMPVGQCFLYDDKVFIRVDDFFRHAANSHEIYGICINGTGWLGKSSAGDLYRTITLEAKEVSP